MSKPIKRPYRQDICKVYVLKGEQIMYERITERKDGKIIVHGTDKDMARKLAYLEDMIEDGSLIFLPKKYKNSKKKNNH